MIALRVHIERHSLKNVNCIPIRFNGLRTISNTHIHTQGIRYLASIFYAANIFVLVCIRHGVGIGYMK